MEKRHIPIHRVLKKLIEEHNIPLEKAEAIELFSREGDWQTVVYAPYVKSLEAWEINLDFYEGLRKNLPNAKIKITDTWKEIKDVTRKYDLIVADTPQATYGENDEHCEHFGLLPDVFRIANDGCVIILNVNKEPYNLQEGSLWWKRRKDYYRTEHPEKLEFNSVIQRYKEILQENNVKMQWCFFQQRHVGFLYYFVMRIQH